MPLINGASIIIKSTCSGAQSRLAVCSHQTAKVCILTGQAPISISLFYSPWTTIHKLLFTSISRGKYILKNTLW